MPTAKQPDENVRKNDALTKGERLEALINLSRNIRDKERRIPISYDDFLYIASIQPKQIFRDIFQYFHDMVEYYIPEGYDEYPSNESSGFLKYKTNKLFIEQCDEPFFADRLFANRFMELVKGFRKGVQNNHIYFFEGPPGSGKSTFLNNLLHKLEEYSKTPKGTVYKIAWKINTSELPINSIPQLQKRIDSHQNGENGKQDKYLHISCPNNCHPVLIIPKELRKDFLNELIPNKQFKQLLFSQKEYEWIFKSKPCAFCSSMYNTLFDMLQEPLKVYRMIYPKKMDFSRQFGKGISIFNPGDLPVSEPIFNNELQHLINETLQTDEIPYKYSYLSHTNNGIYALMDIKDHNKTRLMNLHGIISDGVHKVDQIEERIKTLFVGVINPEDTIHYENVKSFQDRIITINIPYILDFQTEVNIYKNKFGQNVIDSFMPRVISNFSKIIISTRLNTASDILEKWLKKPDVYKSYVDKNLLLLKMELYTGKIPQWLFEEDVNSFNKQIRKTLITETKYEGQKGISGRQSLTIFNNFTSKYASNKQTISMKDIVYYFKNDAILSETIPDDFIDSLNTLYEFNILEEVKESIYFYNKKKMMRDIKNYLFALNFNIGEQIHSHYTGDSFLLTDDYLINIETYLFGSDVSEQEKLKHRKEEHATYITHTLSQEIKNQDKLIDQTDQFNNLMKKYSDNLKKFAFAPYHRNDHFKRCIEAYNTPAFNQFENPLKKTVDRMVTNMVQKFGYTETSAIYIILYVIENNLEERFKNFSLD
jgi:predicted Ser/Thr protein kinase